MYFYVGLFLHNIGAVTGIELEINGVKGIVKVKGSAVDVLILV